MNEFNLISITSLILSVSAILISIIHLILEYISKRRTEIPTIDISVDNLPPYKNNESKTKIRIQNTGTSIGYNPRLEVEYSFTNSKTVIPLEDNLISINEIIERYERLLDPPSGVHSIKFIVDV